MQTNRTPEGIMKTKGRRTLATLSAFGVVMIPVVAKLFSRQPLRGG
jgi:hypothetical protein